MSKEFVDRVANKQLTDVDQYRRMQTALNETKDISSDLSSDKDEWKKWQLAPVSVADSDSNEADYIDPQSKSAQGLLQAMKVLDK